MTNKPTFEAHSVEMPPEADLIQSNIIELYNIYLQQGISAQLIFASIAGGLGVIAGFQNAQSKVPIQIITEVRDANFDEGFKFGAKLPGITEEPSPEPTHPSHPTKQ